MSSLEEMAGEAERVLRKRLWAGCGKGKGVAECGVGGLFEGWGEEGCGGVLYGGE